MADTQTKAPAKVKSEDTSLSLRPWRPFLSLRQEIDRLMDEFDGGFGRLPSRFTEGFFGGRAMPAIDIVEKEQAFEVTAELPGIAEKDIHVDVINGVLRINGETKEEKEEKRENYHLSERRHGSFERRIGLPEGVDADKIEAAFKNGLLTVTLPKTVEAQQPAKKIAIKSA